MEVLDSNNFELKPNERDCKNYFSIISNDYKKAIKYAEETLKSQGFITMRSVGIIGKKNNMTVITNLLARNLLNNDEVACMFSFPRRQQTSTKKIIDRAVKMNGHWKRLHLYICYKTGSGNFPVIARRIYNNKEASRSLTIFSLHLINGEIRELAKPEKGKNYAKIEEKE